MSIKSTMSTMSVASLSTGHVTNPQTPVEMEQMTHKEMMLVQWEEWALSIEEHYHAMDLFNRNPEGQPMGHR